MDGNDILTVKCSNILNSEGFIKGKLSPSQSKWVFYLLKGGVKLLKWSHFSEKPFYDFVYMMPRCAWFGDFNKVKEIIQCSEKMSQNGNLV